MHAVNSLPCDSWRDAPRPGRRLLATMLVDDDIEGDKRVQQAATELGQALRVVDIRDSVAPGLWLRWRVLAQVTRLILQGLREPRRRRELLAPDLDAARLSRFPLSGLLACMRWLTHAVGTAQKLRAMNPEGEPWHIHAHDLYCAVAAVLGPMPPGSRLVYDAHELEIHRNRKVGWVRVLIEHALEQRVLQHTDELRVVNHRIADTMGRWYRLPQVSSVHYNDHYPHHPVSVPPPGERPTLVYIGKGVHGRLLERLDRPADLLGFDVSVYLLGSALPSSISGKYWQHGPLHYEADLLARVASRRCLMWCCAESLSLSYRLATPNKFFQALAVGMPVLAAQGTYLADIVSEHGIGAVFEGGNLGDIAARTRTAEFEGWVARVVHFRERLRRGEVRI
ncbi:glycosyltransferase [Eleftheria terrae]|uniref:glycosyltransferase n=1 Tax=Eleftheria terrae TaxID=1597781 RepID=UPI00263B4B67|nr:glycosyltransferase [Eleftheria terrae]WKB51078.1 glycosyltransferase [Eleftheria terrae]